MSHTPIGECTSDCRRVGCPDPNIYRLYLKSHCEAPDFEAEVEAYTIEQAVVLFQKQVDVDANIIKQNLEVEYA